MGPQYVYTMKGLGKQYPPDHTVLKDIWLSFLPGAKIGVLGLNGAGKSTVLRTMAGEITEFDGEAFPADGISIGYLPQEPQLDASKDVAGNVNEGVAATRALLKRYDRVVASLSEGLVSPEMDEALEAAGRASRHDRRHGSLGPRFTGRHGDGRAPAAARFGGRDDAVGR